MKHKFILSYETTKEAFIRRIDEFMREVENGSTVTITENGKEIARLEPVLDNNNDE